MPEAPSTARIAFFQAALLLAFCLLGCVQMTPVEEVRERLIVDSDELENRFLTHLGYRVHIETGRSVRADAASDRDEIPVVLLHGFASSTWSWRNVLPDLTRQREAVALDFWGFGLSDRPRRSEFYLRSGQVDLVLAVMDQLGFERAHLVGHSYGGAIAMTLAHSHADRVASLTLINSAPPEYPIRRRKLFAALEPAVFTYVRGLGLRNWNVRRVLSMMYHDSEMLDQELVQGYAERLRVEGATDAYFGLTRPLPRARKQKEVAYQELRPKTLVIWGQNDQIVSVENGRFAASQLPEARFEVIEDCGHAPMEERPAEVLRLLLPHFESIEHAFTQSLQPRAGDER